MKKFLIFISILIISVFAFIDAKSLYKELNNLSYSRTPSQIEIRPLIRKDSGKFDNVKFDSNQNQQQEDFRRDANKQHDLQNSIDKMNNQQNNSMDKNFRSY